ncbi:MAG: alpha/beta hydrolase, partial [Gemmatimonadota bacterium]|nr:alpha/beta hydrolase [Gemmatimonadota bacterium]
SGSGPTDRNGNSPAFSGPNNSLAMLAEGLAANGIASLRYDKRGIGASRSAGSGGEASLRFTHFISDASGWIQQLRADPRFSTVTVAGHSEGSLIGMVAARESKADGYVSIAGSGRAAPVIIAEQLSAQLPPAMLEQVVAMMAKIERGEKVDSVPPMLAGLFRPSVQPYLTSWFAFDPAKEIARLAVPALVVQGTTDLQVKVADANLLAAAKPGARLVVIEGMNHVLKAVSGPIGAQLLSYSDPELPVVPQLITEIATYVTSLSEESSPRAKDSLIGIDKLKHFLLAGFVEGVAFAGLQAAGASRIESLAVAGISAAAVSLGRERHDRRTTGLFSFGDLVWDALGAGAAMLVLTRVR